MPKSETPKLRQHYSFPAQNRITVHPVARPAYLAWTHCRVAHRGIDLSSVDEHHRPPIRLVATAEGYQYYHAFERMHCILHHEAVHRHLFLIGNAKDSGILTIAWAEVLQLAFARDVNHALLWTTLVKQCPPLILKALMQVTSLTKKNYSDFAGISIDQLDYQQRQLPKVETTMGLPEDMSWTGIN